MAVALSGGATPRPVYERLAAAPLSERLPWPRIHWFWGDERFVPPDHPDSNYRMVREALLSRVPVPPANIHPVRTEGISPETAAAEYDAELRRFYHDARRADALFDVTLLGIGADGHTASLFPGDGALAEKSRWAVAVRGARAEHTHYPHLPGTRPQPRRRLSRGRRREAPARCRASSPTHPICRRRGSSRWEPSSSFSTGQPRRSSCRDRSTR